MTDQEKTNLRASAGIRRQIARHHRGDGGREAT